MRPKACPLLNFGVENDLQAIVAQAEASQAEISTRSDWDQAKAAILGPKGTLTQASKLIGQLPREEKPAFGQALNKAKKEVEAFNALENEVKEKQWLLYNKYCRVATVEASKCAEKIEQLKSTQSGENEKMEELEKV